MSAVAPRWYLRAETPVGTRWFYPKPPDTETPWRARDHRWTDIEGTPLELRGTALVSDHPLEEVVEHWTEPEHTTSYRLREPGSVPEMLRPLLASDSYPAALTRDEYRERTNYGDETAADIYRQLYEGIRSEPVGQHATHHLSDLVEIPGEPDPDPEVVWTLDQPLTGGFYGPLVAHLFPGWISGDLLQARVVELASAQFRELGLRSTGFGEPVHSWRNDRKVSLSASLVWDEVLPYDTMRGNSRRAREYNRDRLREATIATHWSAEVKIPREVHGGTKALALMNLEHQARMLVAELLPPHTVACARCRGRGYVK